MPNASSSAANSRRHRDAAHQPVVGVDGDPEAEPPQEVDRVLRDRRRAAPVWTFDVGHISSGTRRSRTNAASRPRSTEPSSRTVMSSTIRTPWPSRSAPHELERLPDRRQPERLAGMDRDVEVLAPDVARRRRGGGSAGSPPRGRRCRTRRRPRRASGRRTRRPRPSGRPGASPSRAASIVIGCPAAAARRVPTRNPSRFARDDLVEGQPSLRATARARSGPRRRRPRRRRGPRRTRRRRGRSRRFSCMTPKVCSKVSR